MRVCTDYPLPLPSYVAFPTSSPFYTILLLLWYLDSNLVTKFKSATEFVFILLPIYVLSCRLKLCHLIRIQLQISDRRGGRARCAKTGLKRCRNPQYRDPKTRYMKSSKDYGYPDKEEREQTVKLWWPKVDHKTISLGRNSRPTDRLVRTMSGGRK